MKPKSEPKVKSVKEILGLLGEQMDQLRPVNKPSTESTQAAKGTATLVNSYLSTVRLTIDASRIGGKSPDLRFLGIADTQVAQAA